MRLIDITGRRFGRLVVLSQIKKRTDSSGYVLWHCRCDCGKRILTRGNNLRSGDTKSCGCWASEVFSKNGRVRLIDITGQRYGRLVVLSKTKKRNSSGYVFWRCRCNCGAKVLVQSNELRRGKTKSCGCLRQEVSAKIGRGSRTHGESGGGNKRRAREYRSWNALKQRCHNPKNPGFAYYGRRGITICARWMNSYENFLADMGRCPPGYTLDRINNDGNYEPGNCRWTTASEQLKNRRPRKRRAAGKRS